jgi:hypothetical protein
MDTGSKLQIKIQNMIDELPDSPADERRSPLLTKHDARWLANLALVISEHQVCHIGLCDAQAEALKEMSANDIRSTKQMVKERRRLLAIIGTGVVAILVFIGKAALASIDPEFWKHFINHMMGK